MSDTTKISWCDHTWNWVQGCTKISEACKHCYMYRDKERYGQDPSAVVRSAPRTFRAPLAKNQEGSWKWPDGGTVFTCSWSDFFHEGADTHRADAWEIIRQRPGLRFLVLTKRPERMADHLPPEWGSGWRNVALGVTVENQARAVERIQTLLETPAVYRFASCEPLLSGVRLKDIRRDGCFHLNALTSPSASIQSDHTPFARLDWVIAGGESGPDARPSHPDWFRRLRDDCKENQVPFHFKQWGEWGPAPGAQEEDWQKRRNENPGVSWGMMRECGDFRGGIPGGVRGSDCVVWRVGTKRTGRALDGAEWNEFPRWERG